jgi:hypothetical protein
MNVWFFMAFLFNDAVLFFHARFVGVVERPDPKGLPTFSQCMSSCRTGDSNSCPPGALTK